MMWIYRLPSAITSRPWTIAFRYPPPVGSLRLCLRCNNGADAFIHSEVFEHEYYRLRFAAAPKTILDLGANIGLSAIYFARMFPDAKLACVEPEPNNVRVLGRNLKLNGVDATIIPAAVDVKDGRVVFELGDRDYAHRILAPGKRASRPTIEVEAISVPNILKRLSWERIDLVKIDIEGHEAELFARDCDWLYCVDSVCLEYHHHFPEANLSRIAEVYGFHSPRRLPGGIWFMSRSFAC
jgi:FkbM family methyltransferase